MPPILIYLFQNNPGRSPILKWLLGLRDEEFEECRALILLLSRLGFEAEFPDSRPMGKGLFELRGSEGRIQLRMLYCFLPGSRAVLLCGFSKDQPQTPRAELDRARERQALVLQDPDRYLMALDPEALDIDRKGRRKSK